ncbi:MAG: hypothetical protein HZB71_14505 [Betaproteobacteria bacterium]|nr:hypothetical protein [Betaproteobacteria bacterium]
MQKSIAVTLAALLFAAQPALAAPADDACGALMEARGHLVAMIGSGDKAVQDDLKGKIHAASAKLDGVLAAMAKSYNADNEGKAAAFKPVWEAFKNTREGEIIPNVYAGKVAEAKAVAGGVQAERMKQMKGAMGCK